MQMITPATPEPPVSVFTIPGCNFDELGLRIEPGMDFGQWERLLRLLERWGQGIQWYIGDALNYGEKEYGEKYAQVLDAHKKTGIPINTLRDYQQVAGHVPVDVRTSGVDWSTHREVARLPKPKQKEILTRAKTENLTKREVEKVVERLTRKPEIDVLHEPIVRAWLERDIEEQRMKEATIPVEAVFLRSMIHARIGQSMWQLERTVEGDCRLIKRAVSECLGSDDDVFMWLQERGYYMSDPELEDRLDLMVSSGQIRMKQAEGRKKTQRGKMVDVYLPIYGLNDEDDEE